MYSGGDTDSMKISILGMGGLWWLLRLQTIYECSGFWERFILRLYLSLSSFRFFTVSPSPLLFRYATLATTGTSYRLMADAPDTYPNTHRLSP